MRIRSSCSRQAASSQIPAEGYGEFARFLGGVETAEAAVSTRALVGAVALRDKLRGEKDLVIIFGSEISGNGVQALAKFAASVRARS